MMSDLTFLSQGGCCFCMPHTGAGCRLALTPSHATIYWIGLHLPLTLPVAFLGNTPKAADKVEQPSGEQSCLGSKQPLLLQALPSSTCSAWGAQMSRAWSNNGKCWQVCSGRNLAVLHSHCRH